MPSKNPYEIRASILVDAHQMLFRVWERKCDTIENRRHQIRRFIDDDPATRAAVSKMLQNGNAKDYAVLMSESELPPAPTIEEILSLAGQMDSFVSAKS